MRVTKIKTPILILSGMAGIEDKVKGLGHGADDYLTKPFHKDELVARIHAIVRRSKGHAQSVIVTGDLIVNLDQKTVEVDGARVHLTGKEYQMLELLSLRKGTTLTKEMFLNHLYGGMDEPELKIIDVFICKLRKKLASASRAATTSKPCGAAATCCASRRRGTSASRPESIDRFAIRSFPAGSSERGFFCATAPVQRLARLIQFGELRVAQRDLGRRGVFVEMRDLRRAGDRQHDGAALQQPGERDLPGVAPCVRATRSSAPPGCDSAPAASGNQGMKPMPCCSQ